MKIHIQKRIAITLGLVFLWKALTFIPVPGLNPEIVRAVYQNSNFDQFSIFSLGFMPFINAYVFVEIMSLFIPRMKSWRDQGSSGRAKLRLCAYAGSVLLAVVQSFALIHAWMRMPTPQGWPIVSPDFGTPFLIMFSLLGGTFLLLLLARTITDYGIGHGFSVLVLAGISSNFPNIYRNLADLASRSPGLPMGVYVRFLIPATCLVGLIIWVETLQKAVPIHFEDGSKAILPIKLTTAGILPLSWSSSLLSLPVVFLMFLPPGNFDSRPILNLFSSPVAQIVVLIPIYLFFTSIFYESGKIVQILGHVRGKLVMGGVNGGEKTLDPVLTRFAAWGILYLTLFVVLPLLPEGKVYFPRTLIPEIITVVVIALDLYGEFKIAQEQGPLTRLAELHSVPLAGVLKSLLESKGIPCYLKGYYHRALLYFLGPYLEMGLYVPSGREREALETIRTYQPLVR